MNILALESGADFWGVALVGVETDELLPFGENLRSLAVAIENDPRSLASNLFEKIQSVLDLSESTLSRIDAIAVGIGPGSWTGLRIGITAMKTLAQTQEIPLVGVPSFDSVAQAACRLQRKNQSRSTHEQSPCEQSTLTLVTAPCRPGEVYGKIYGCRAELPEALHDESIRSPLEFAELLSAEVLSRKVLSHGAETPPVIAGSYARKLAELLTERGQEHVVVEPKREALLVETAINCANAVAAGRVSDALTLAPLYLAPSNAERNLVTAK